ncbi:hypothetical protein EDB82DRAFT_294895 [Fusarium venenatum]|uniref:uncharacterized protein n=1 Tax=Fusarium venenatum TaxID=56646 RepID=UPI001DEB12E6|nr:hypothetical protein EDB82DRAFT_294895 [Fusarium venenatum]
MRLVTQNLCPCRLTRKRMTLASQGSRLMTSNLDPAQQPFQYTGTEFILYGGYLLRLACMYSQRPRRRKHRLCWLARFQGKIHFWGTKTTQPQFNTQFRGMRWAGWDKRPQNLVETKEQRELFPQRNRSATQCNTNVEVAFQQRKYGQWPHEVISIHRRSRCRNRAFQGRRYSIKTAQSLFAGTLVWGRLSCPLPISDLLSVLLCYLTRNTISEFFLGVWRIREEKGSPFRVARKRGLESDGTGVLTILMAQKLQRPSGQAAGASKLLKKVVNKRENPPAISKENGLATSETAKRQRWTNQPSTGCTGTG